MRNEWQNESSQVSLSINPDRANLRASPTTDVANSATGALSGVPVTTLQDGDRNIPVVARLRMDERAQLSDIQNLYVYGSQTNTQNSAGANLEREYDASNRTHHSPGPLPVDVHLRLPGAGPSGVGDHQNGSAEAA